MSDMLEKSKKFINEHLPSFVPLEEHFPELTSPLLWGCFRGDPPEKCISYLYGFIDGLYSANAISDYCYTSCIDELDQLVRD